jgi:hypothetical protein
MNLGRRTTTRPGVKQADPTLIQQPALNKAGPFSYSCVMAPVDGPAKMFIDAFAAGIPKSLLAADGVETDLHVTALYGLHTDSPKDVVEVLRGVGPVEMTLGKTKIFPADANHPDYDVLYIEVDSPDLTALNKSLALLDHSNDYAEYKPHITVAYLIPGAGKKYVGKTVYPGVVTVPMLEFANTNGEKINIPLLGKLRASGPSLNSDQMVVQSLLGDFIDRRRRGAAEGEQRLPFIPTRPRRTTRR